MLMPSNTVLSVALSALLLTACGGSGSDSDLSSSNDWSLNPAGVSSYTAAATNFQGPISGLGSIVVNGVRFETTNASVYDPDSFDDSTLFGSSLGMGMTVAGLRGPGPRGGRVLAMVAVRLGQGGCTGNKGDGPGEGGDGGQGLHGLSLGGGAICPLLSTGRHTGRDWMRPVKTSPSRPAKVFA